MTRPTVLVLIKGLGIGGAERLIADGAAFWDREAYDYRVAYVLPWKDQVVGDLEALDIPVRCIGTTKGFRPPVVGRLRALLDEWGVDIIHVHSPAVAALARLVKGDRTLVYTEHNVVDSYRLPTRVANRLTYTRNDAVIGVSDAVGESVTKYPGPNAEVIPNGVSARFRPDEAATARAELGLSADDPLIVHVGNIRPHKGHSNLIAAVNVLAETHPSITVVSIGGEKYDGDLERVRQEAADSGVSNQIQFLGRRTDARAFTEAATVYVNPSDFEGLPVAILEAMALARPIVATAVGGVASVITESTGILIPEKDPQALASAVAALLDDAARATMLGKAAQDLVESEFGLDGMIAATEAVYAEAMGRG